jgi:aldehyde:ferredoxin oxidoreductase
MTDLSPEKLREAHQVTAEMQYETLPVVRGYANRTLYVNLSDSTIRSKPVTEEMKEIFTGGRGFCLKLLWDGITEETRWNDPENELIIAGGPIGGITAYPGSGKCTVVTLSPLTGIPIDSNSGGYFGPYLKFAGWDALEIQGKAGRDVIIVIDGDIGRVTVEEAPLEALDTHILNRQLTEMYALDERDMRNISVVSAGQAADHVPMCGLNISYYDPRRKEVRIKQAARGGAGRVLRDKRIKAIVVRYADTGGDSNGVANMELIRAAGKRINSEISRFDASQNDMRGTGTPYLIEIMNKFDLLPVQNFRFGADSQAHQIAGEIFKEQCTIRTARMAAGMAARCRARMVFPTFIYRLGLIRDRRYLWMVRSMKTWERWHQICGIFDPQAALELNFYCDTYGIDTISAGNSIAFAMECYENGILTPDITGGMELTWGNSAAAIELLHQMARGEGFGVIVGQGIRGMKQIFFEQYNADPEFMQDIGMEIKGLELSEYLSKESLAQQGGYALASKGPQHDEAWLIFMDMVHKQIPTFEDKAEALHFFPVFRTWFSLHGLCKLPWNDIIPESNKTAAEPAKVPEHIENYLNLHEGVTGKKVTLDDLMLQSERVYNFQRVFNLRCGYGTREYDYPPYRAMGPVTALEYESRAERYDASLRDDVGIDPAGMSTEAKMAALRQYRENRYEQLVDAVYTRRGWTRNGIPTVDKLKSLGIDFPELVEQVKQHGG